MNENLLAAIIELAEVDGVLARVTGEKKKLEAGAAKQKQSYVDLMKLTEAKTKSFKASKAAFEKEEIFLKEERDKIAERRKGIASHNNYKVQQAAEKELDFSARQLNLKEEALLTKLAEIEQLQAESKAATELLATERTALEAFLAEAKATMPSLEERLQRQTARRQEIITRIDQKQLAFYDRVRNRHPMDPVVAVNAQQGCSGCFMTVGPQIVVKIATGDSLIQCPGCMRILYLSNELKELSEASHK
jgi:predicted  nucleic acid-binding Zn-ribbon protein